jgi:gluconolactonase
MNFLKYGQFLIFIFITTSCRPTDIHFTNWELVVDNQNFPEGITYDHKGNLYSSNCYGGWITKITNNSIDTFLTASDSTFGKTNGLFALKDGSVIATDFENGSILKFSSTGNVDIIVTGYDGAPFNRPNDLILDNNGNFYFTDPNSYGKDKLDGRVFYYNFSDSTIKLVQSDLAFPNGIGISPIDGRLYVGESAQTRILSFKIAEDGILEDKKVFVDLPGGDPDGFNFDIEGNLYVAHFGSGHLYTISPKGEIISKIKTPGKKPTNVEFAGKDRKTLYLTEAETNSIYKIGVNISGY